MKFNTAIFYDIENLIGGYSLSNAELLSNLSLKHIAEQIKHDEIGNIAIQRAYADWSVPRLNQIKTDMVELGIVPVQMFGFGKGITRNAADIHLAIDVIEVALTKPDINVFVIVSGDGGYSALASKLHEYGKIVIGFGYKRQANKVFEAVTDEYIWLNETKAVDEPVISNNGYDINQFHVSSYAKKYKPTNEVTLDKAKSVSQEIIDFIISDVDLYDKLNNVGINISVFIEILRYRMIGFQTKNIGYAKAIDFVKAVVKESDIKIVFRGTDFRLTMKNNNPIGYNDLLIDNDSVDEHTVENYRKILLEENPSFRQFDKKILSDICDYLGRHRLRYKNAPMDELAKKLSVKTDVDMLEIVKGITTLISGDCFRLDDNNLITHKLSYLPSNTQQAFEFLENAMKIKLYEKLKEVNMSIFKEIIR
ncbi:MAG: NYN domain-containing protein [Paludibacter sp.]